jgi:hypothetical protein
MPPPFAPALKVVQEIAQLRNHFRRRLGEPASIRTNRRIIVAQQLQHRGRRQFGLKACGCGNGSLETRSLNRLPGDQPSERLCRIPAGNLGESINRSRLFGHHPIGAKTRKTAAQSFERGDRGGHAAPPRFGGEGETVCKACMGQRGQQFLVLDAIQPDDRPRHLVIGRRFDRSRDIAEQIELPHLASRVGKIAEEGYRVRRHHLPHFVKGLQPESG